MELRALRQFQAFLLESKKISDILAGERGNADLNEVFEYFLRQVDDEIEHVLNNRMKPDSKD